MGLTDIKQLLPRDSYNAIVGANAPSASNVFATIADIPSAANIYTNNGSLSANRTVTLGVRTLTFNGVGTNSRSVYFSLYPDGANVGIYSYVTAAAGFYNNIEQRPSQLTIDIVGNANGSGSYCQFGGQGVSLNYYDGPSGDYNETNLSVSGFAISTPVGTSGAHYAADYSTNGIANHGDRWIPDAGYVKNANIYGTNGTLTATRIVSLDANNLSFDNSGFGSLLHFDATNNRVGIGTNAPGYGLHVANGYVYFQNANLSIGGTPPDASHKFRVTTSNTDGNNFSASRFDLSHDSATGTFQGVQIRSTNVKSGATSTIYGVNSNLTGSVSAGTHTFVAGRFAVSTAAAGGTVNKYALQLQDGTEGTAGWVWASVDTTGLGHWVNPNTLVTFPVTAVAQTYTPSNVTTDRTFDADSTTLDEIADVVGTLIADLKTSGIIL